MINRPAVAATRAVNSLRLARIARLTAAASRAGPLAAGLVALGGGVYILKKSLDHETIPSRSPLARTVPVIDTDPIVQPTMPRNRNTAGGSKQVFTYQPQRRKSNSTKPIQVPATMSGVTTRIPPSLSSAGNSLTISHCEPFATATLTALGVLVNASIAMIPTAFPYLAGIATNFGKFRWRRLRIYYVPSCPTTTQGEVVMAQVFDTQDATAFSYVECSGMSDSVAFPPWAGGPPIGPGSVGTDVDCSKFDKPRYDVVTLTTYNALTTSDKNNYTPVRWVYASQGSTAAVTIAGRFWAAYTVELLNPIPPTTNA